MIPDVKPPVGSWQNLYTLSGFSVGTRLLIQNKSAGGVLVWEGAAPPPEIGGDDRHGYSIMGNGEPVKTGASPAGVWVMCWSGGDFSGLGRLCVQEYIP